MNIKNYYLYVKNNKSIQFLIGLFLILIAFSYPVNAWSVEQNYNNLAGTYRFFDIEYININTQPLILNVKVTNECDINLESWTNLIVNGTSMQDIGFVEFCNTFITLTDSIFFVIPPNAIYKIAQGSAGGGTPVLNLWYESNGTDDLPIQNVSNDNFLKSIKISDFINYNYNYTIFLNGTYWKELKKDDILLIPDDSSILIYIPSPIKTSTDNIWNLSIKPMLFTMIGFILSWGILIILVCYSLYLIQRKIRKGY